MNFGNDVTKNDSISDAANKILNAHIAGNVVILCTTCVVKYIGTAESKLPPEKRTVIIKPDDSLLVHSSTGVKPVNWQTSKSTINLRIENENLIIESSHKDEELFIKCFSIHKSIHYMPPEYDVKAIVGTENDMHNAIIKTPSLIEKGLHSIKHEKEIDSGSIDIYAIDKNDIPVVIEVKRRKAQLKHVDQLNRYVSKLEETEDEIRGILVAPSISSSAKSELESKQLEFCVLKPSEVIPDNFN